MKTLSAIGVVIRGLTIPQLTMSVDYSEHVVRASPRAIDEAAWTQTGRNLASAFAKIGKGQESGKSVKAAS